MRSPPVPLAGRALAAVVGGGAPLPPPPRPEPPPLRGGAFPRGLERRAPVSETPPPTRERRHPPHETPGGASRRDSRDLRGDPSGFETRHLTGGTRGSRLETREPRVETREMARGTSKERAGPLRRRRKRLRMVPSRLDPRREASQLAGVAFHRACSRLNLTRSRLGLTSSRLRPAGCALRLASSRLEKNSRAPPIRPGRVPPASVGMPGTSV